MISGVLEAFRDQHTDGGDDAVGKVPATQHEDWGLDVHYSCKTGCSHEFL